MVEYEFAWHRAGTPLGVNADPDGALLVVDRDEALRPYAPTGRNNAHVFSFEKQRWEAAKYEEDGAKLGIFFWWKTQVGRAKQDAAVWNAADGGAHNVLAVHFPFDVGSDTYGQILDAEGGARDVEPLSDNATSYFNMRQKLAIVSDDNMLRRLDLSYPLPSGRVVWVKSDTGKYVLSAAMPTAPSKLYSTTAVAGVVDAKIKKLHRELARVATKMVITLDEPHFVPTAFIFAKGDAKLQPFATEVEGAYAAADDRGKMWRVERSVGGISQMLPMSPPLPTAAPNPALDDSYRALINVATLAIVEDVKNETVRKFLPTVAAFGLASPSRSSADVVATILTHVLQVRGLQSSPRWKDLLIKSFRSNVLVKPADILPGLVPKTPVVCYM